MKAERYIVAIDLGTSKIALCVASVEDNNVDVVFYDERPSKGIARSVVQNVRQATEILKEMVVKAEEELGIKITQAVVGIPKYYIRQESKTAKIELDENNEITRDEVNSLMDIAKTSIEIPEESGESIYGAIAQSYCDGEEFQVSESEIIGRYSSMLEGNFKVLIGKRSHLNNIDNLFSKLDISAIRKYFTADTTAYSVLNKSEMENGVALVDLGAGATSVAVYQGSILRHYAAIPFGGQNITMDIKQECAISEELAENIKKGFGICMPDRLQNMNEKMLQIKGDGADPDTQISIKYLSEVITARMDEIIDAVLYEIQESGFADRLRSGIVITGGGVELGNCTTLFEEKSGYFVRTGYPKNRFASSKGEAKTVMATACTGMILAAKEEHKLNCATEPDSKQKVELKVVRNNNNGTLFNDEETSAELEQDNKKKELETLAEIRKKREDERKKREEEKKKGTAKRNETKNNGGGFWGRQSNFISSLFEDDEKA